MLEFCPACGHDLRGTDFANHLFTDHRPGDFGRSLRELKEIGYMSDILYNQTDTCEWCGEEKKVAVLPSGQKICKECEHTD